MRRIIMAVGCLVIVMLHNVSAAENNAENNIESDINELVGNLTDCDTVVAHEGYNIHMIKQDDKIAYLGLNLFSDETKQSMGREILNRIETDLLTKCLDSENENTSVRLISGDIKSFKTITPETSHSVTSSNSRSVIVEWDTENGPVSVELPLSYQNVKGGSRSDIEKTFIANVRNHDGRRGKTRVNLENAEPYGDNQYIVPGNSYQSRDITRNIFLTTDSVADPVWDSNFPLESIANMFICPDRKYDGKKLNVTVLKHEYGEKETFSTTIDKLLAYCEKEGCEPYWGVEKFQDGKLEGALFLFNQLQGYDHVLKIECIPGEIIDGDGVITARASLFVPTNNVSNLFQPYSKKSEKEKIRYDRD